jgi:uncharacterized membrane protein
MPDPTPLSCRDALLRAIAGAALLLMLAAPARADLKLCNRLSYVVTTAIGVEDAGTTATRGWFRIDPGQCRAVLAGDITAQHLYVHAQALSMYGPSPLPQAGHADLCVAQGDFTIATARACRASQSTTRFTEIRPSETAEGPVAVLAEDADYSDEQARLAGIQRLLVMSGYDANPIDGVTDPKTEAALARFLADHGLGAEAASAPNFFDVLIDAAQKPSGTGFSWCNDTAWPVMAALGVEEKGTIVTRGWYRVEAGKCLRPEIRGRQRKLYSFAEAVDADGRALKRDDKPIAWGGDTVLCTREVKFELSYNKNCVARGLLASGFVEIDLAARPSTTVRFKE